MAARCCDDPVLSRILLLERIGVPHGRAEHKFTYGYTDLSRCASCGGGLVEHFSHDCFEAEHSSWDMYWWWRIDAADIPGVCKLIAFCPAPLDGACECLLHRSLRAQTPQPLPRSVETVDEAAVIPRVGVRVVDAAPRWVSVD